MEVAELLDADPLLAAHAAPPADEEHAAPPADEEHVWWRMITVYGDIRVVT